MSELIFSERVLCPRCRLTWASCSCPPPAPDVPTTDVLAPLTAQSNVPEYQYGWQHRLAMALEERNALCALLLEWDDQYHEQLLREARARLTAIREGR